MHRRTLCENLLDVSLRHSTRQEAAERCQKLRRAARENVRGASDRVLLIGVPALDQVCINATALGEKSSDFPSPAI
jgi:hypothetical protein